MKIANGLVKICICVVGRRPDDGIHFKRNTDRGISYFLVVGDCPATKPSARTPTMAADGFIGVGYGRPTQAQLMWVVMIIFCNSASDLKINSSTII